MMQIMWHSKIMTHMYHYLQCIHLWTETGQKLIAWEYVTKNLEESFLRLQYIIQAGREEYGALFGRAPPVQHGSLHLKD